MQATRTPSKALNITKAPPQVLRDPIPTVIEIEQEPAVGPHSGSIDAKRPTLMALHLAFADRAASQARCTYGTVLADQ